MSTLRQRPPLPIRLSRATGTGPTALAAFDAALRGAGTANFNLVRLSSVIPPASTVAVLEPTAAPRRVGRQAVRRLRRVAGRGAR